jgi:protein-L-isoaspartate(D-aspartate) O-methyltransferase
MSLPTDYQTARRRMLHSQLLGRGIASQSVLDAMDRVPRERFLEGSMQDQAYADRALPIECGQTISQPYIVALMTEALELTGAERVLEIGTGSGYQTAVLAELAREVITIERHKDLLRHAEQILAELGYRNITAIVGDGSLGWPQQAPYDRIIVTAAAGNCPPALKQQLKDGGVLVIPLGTSENQDLVQLRKRDTQWESTSLSLCRFVPLIGEQGWPQS